MRRKRVLIIGGTRDARLLAARLIAAGFDPVTSMAGATEEPRLPPGEVRIGGFGGAEGLAAYLDEAAIMALIDAAHPFAVRISDNGGRAAALAGVPHLRYERPRWQPQQGDRWIEVADTAAAAAAVTEGARVLLTIGTRGLDPFFVRSDLSGIVRMIGTPGTPLPAGWALLQARPPFRLDDEVRLMRSGGVGVVVTKNSGGPADAKLKAARMLALPVVMIARPAKPAAETTSSADAVIAWLHQAGGIAISGRVQEC